MTKNTKKKNLKSLNKINGFYVRDEPLTIYKSGNSKVVTIPAEFPFEIGDELDVSYQGGSITLVKKGKDAVAEDDTWRSEIRSLQKKYGFKYEAMSIDEYEEVLEGIYE